MKTPRAHPSDGDHTAGRRKLVDDAKSGPGQVDDPNRAVQRLAMQVFDRLKGLPAAEHVPQERILDTLQRVVALLDQLKDGSYPKESPMVPDGSGAISPVKSQDESHDETKGGIRSELAEMELRVARIIESSAAANSTRLDRLEARILERMEALEAALERFPGGI